VYTKAGLLLLPLLDVALVVKKMSRVLFACCCSQHAASMQAAAVMAVPGKMQLHSCYPCQAKLQVRYVPEVPNEGCYLLLCRWWFKCQEDARPTPGAAAAAAAGTEVCELAEEESQILHMGNDVLDLHGKQVRFRSIPRKLRCRDTISVSCCEKATCI
jgi:hypothetical protein